MPKANILVVDDEAGVRDTLSSIVGKRFDCTVDKASSGEEALDKLAKTSYDLVILDIRMPGLSGIDVIKAAVTFTPTTKFLAISAYDSHEVADEALKAGACDFLHKPQTAEAIELKVKGILTKINKYAPKKR